MNDYDNCGKHETVSRAGRTLDRLDDTPYLTRNVFIEPLHYGYLVNVGCNRFAIENIADVLKYLEKYYADPKEVETLWLEHKKLPEL